MSYLGIFHGVIDRNSLSRPYTDAEWAVNTSAGDVTQARIIFVDHGGKSVRLSIRPHVLEMRVPNNLPPLGKLCTLRYRLL